MTSLAATLAGPAAPATPRLAFWLVPLAAVGTFALTMGTRPTMGLFLSPLDTSTGRGLGQIRLAFAFGNVLAVGAARIPLAIREAAPARAVAAP